MRIRMLGPLSISRGGVDVPLPASRKVRALFAYLAMAPRPVARNALCELLWDLPNDPRGELRWCLSKIRRVVDEPGQPRVLTAEGTVQLELSGCVVDALDVLRGAEDGIESLAVERQRQLYDLFTGEFLDGLDIDRSPTFEAWLTAQRRRLSGYRTALLEQLVKRVSDEEAFGYLEQWLQLAPFDPQVHERLLIALARAGRVREAEAHLAAASRQFEDEGLDAGVLHHAWRAAKPQRASPQRDSPQRDSPQQPSPQPASIAGADVDEVMVPRLPHRASIAVMPFFDASAAMDARGGAADALAHDVITRLAQLRSLFVIAQGSVFALHERRVGPEEAGRLLNVDYVVSGSVRRDATRLSVSVELSDTRTARLIWSDVFNRTPDDALAVLDEIGNRIVASVASEIETLERNRAILKPPNSLDAWEAHHRGLWHMYLFTQADNARAQQFFEMAVRLDPTFSRAYAGLSFTHFQSAFQGWAPRDAETDLAYDAAGRSVMVDDRDPAAHWAMGRALWLRGRHQESVGELERSIDLSPNFATGYYTLSFVHSQANNPHAAIEASDRARQLSPFDPLLFGMLATRAMSLMRLGQFEEAAVWGEKAAARANAHPHILAIAAYGLALAGSVDEARDYMATIRKSRPDYGITDFLRAFRFDVEGEKLFRGSAERIEKSTAAGPRRKAT
jgi:DNA-binding SARP family transcriptional activator/TolB-like protein